MAARITEIVAERGKLHNPETDSGGMLLARSRRSGSASPIRPRPETAWSRSLDDAHAAAAGRGHELDPASPQVEVAGTAYVFDRGFWAPLPDDLPLQTALEVSTSARRRTRRAS